MSRSLFLKKKQGILYRMKKTTLHGYFFIMKKRLYRILQRFFHRVREYISSKVCLVCYNNEHHVSHYCSCTFRMCTICFKKIVFTCPLCRSEHKSVNYAKHVHLVALQQRLQHVLRHTWDKTRIARIVQNLHTMIQETQDGDKTCLDILDFIEKQHRHPTPISSSPSPSPTPTPSTRSDDCIVS